MSPRSIDESITVDEVREILEALTHADKYRLSCQSAIFAQSSGMASEDLLHEAMRRALDGSRVCPRSTNFMVFLRNSMRSIAFEERKQWKRDTPLGMDLNERNPIIRERDTRPTPEEIIANEQDEKEKICTIEEMFADDPKGLAIVMGDMDGCTPAEICEIEPMSEKGYATARRRVRRAIGKKFQEGRIK